MKQNFAKKKSHKIQGRRVFYLTNNYQKSDNNLVANYQIKKSCNYNVLIFLKAPKKNYFL